MTFKTSASKRSASKTKHGNTGRVRPPALSQKPVLKLNERAKGMSIDEIVRMMPASPDVFNAVDVRTVKSRNGQTYPKRGKLKNGNIAVSYWTRTDDDSKDSPRYHSQLIYARDPEYRGKLIDCKQVVFSCDCPRFKYMWEYALWKRGAAEIRYGNGEPPNVTNKRMRPAACKHFFRVRKGLLQRKW